MKRTCLILCLLFSINGFANKNSNPNIKCESTDPNKKVDMKCIENKLKTSGLGGWVHASVKDQQMFVFTWRQPGNFFVNLQLPMSSKDPELNKRIGQLKRHDQIVLKGEFFKNEAPLKHINVTELKMIQTYTGPSEEYEYDTTLPDKILQNRSLIGKVHIVANGGAVLVVEVGDRVYPVFNPKPALTKDLFRNDKIELQYFVRFFPNQPPHLEVEVYAKNPIRVIEEIAVGHGQPLTLSGPLVMFPKSPQIKFNVFALRTEDADGVSRNYTIVNFDDIDLFFEIRDKLQKAWTLSEEFAVYDRNKYINRRIKITVEGSKNLVSPVQANPQIIPIKIDDVKIELI